MIDWQALADWCTATVAATDLPPAFVVGPETRKQQFPDTLGFINPTPGGAARSEGIERLPGFQVRIRTLAEYQSQALMQADLIDQALLFGDWGGPDLVWGTRIVAIEHSGGEPVPLPQDDTHDRVSVVCSYLAHEVVQIVGSRP